MAIAATLRSSFAVNLLNGSAMLVGIFKNFLNKHIKAALHPFIKPIMGKRFTENRHAIPQPHVIGEGILAHDEGA